MHDSDLVDDDSDIDLGGIDRACRDAALSGPSRAPAAIDATYLAHATVHHAQALAHAVQSVEALMLANWYDSRPRSVDPEVAITRGAMRRRLSRRHRKQERISLARLNAALLVGGAAIGDEVHVCGHVYRVIKSGGSALCLGRVIPTDDELDAAFETTAPIDYEAEARAEYLDVTRVN